MGKFGYCHHCKCVTVEDDSTITDVSQTLWAHSRLYRYLCTYHMWSNSRSMLIINHCVLFQILTGAFTEKGLCLSLSWLFREIYLRIRLELDVTTKSCYIKYTFLAHLMCRCKKTWLSHNLFPCIGLWASCIIWCEDQRTLRMFFQMS